MARRTAASGAGVRQLDGARGVPIHPQLNKKRVQVEGAAAFGVGRGNRLECRSAERVVDGADHLTQRPNFTGVAARFP